MKKDEIYYIPEASPVAPSKFDVRVQLRNRSRGVITPDEMKQHLASLPDESANAESRDFDAVVNDEKEVAAPSTPGLTH